MNIRYTTFPCPISNPEVEAGDKTDGKYVPLRLIDDRKKTAFIDEKVEHKDTSFLKDVDQKN